MIPVRPRKQFFQIARFGAVCALAFTPFTKAQNSSGSSAPDQNRQISKVSPVLSDILLVSLNGRSVTLSPDQLAAMPQTSVVVHNGHSNVDEQFQGVALADLLAGLGLPQGHGPTQAQLLHSYVRAQGTDNYFVIFSAIEIDHLLHKGDVIIALTRSGKSLKSEGRLMLVSTEDTLPMRSVHNLSSLTFSTVN